MHRIFANRCLSAATVSVPIKQLAGSASGSCFARVQIQRACVATLSMHTKGRSPFISRLPKTIFRPASIPANPIAAANAAAAQIDAMNEQDYRNEVRNIMVRYLHTKLILRGQHDQTYSTEHIMAEYTPRDPPTMVDDLLMRASDSFEAALGNQLSAIDKPDSVGTLVATLPMVFSGEFCWGLMVTILNYIHESARCFIQDGRPEDVAHIVEVTTEFLCSPLMRSSITNYGGWRQFVRDYDHLLDQAPTIEV